MSATVRTGAVRLNVATVTQYLASQSDRLVSGKHRVVLLRGAPVWAASPELGWGDRWAKVATAPSPLAAVELVLNHLAPGANGPDVLVVLTDQEESDLGADLLARVYRRRVIAVDIWDVVREAFGAQRVDERLPAENWAAEALLDAAPPGGWPKLAGGPLTRRHALASLTLRRLGAGLYDPDQERRSLGVGGGVELDVNTLLHWSLSANGPARFLALRIPERVGLTRFLSGDDQAGLAGRALMALVEAGHGTDAVAFGLVCAALWVHADSSADADDYRARGRAERWFSDEPTMRGVDLDAQAKALGMACEEFVTVLLTARSGDEDATAASRRLCATVLDRAATLTRQLGTERAAGRSPVLAAGLESAFAAVGRWLADADLARTAQAMRELSLHRLAPGPDARIRVERARMAQRLAQWVATEPVAGSDSVAAGVDRQVAEIGWVDLALEHIEAGGDPQPELEAAYNKIRTAVRARRQRIDERFADTLAAWTSAGEDTEAMLTAVSFPARVVAPVVTAGERPVLLVLLAEMNAATAAELGEELCRDWAEYDPLPGAKDTPHRRGMAATLPAVTTSSRHKKVPLFGGQSIWDGREVAFLHRDDLRAEHDDDAFGPELAEALTADSTHVAVVLDITDDRPATKRKPGAGRSRPGSIGGLRELLRLAAEHGRAVLLTGNHVHIPDRNGVPASLAEFAIPILALLPFGAAPPKGWRELGNQQPPWWSPPADMASQPTFEAPANRPATHKRTIRKSPADTGRPALFEMAVLPDGAEALLTVQPVTSSDTLVTALLESELFQAQWRSLARRPSLGQVEKALRALLDAGGILPVTALAQRIGLLAGRADGFSAVLRQLLNFDGIQALETLPDGRTLRLNTALVSDQFELRRAV